MYNPSGQQFDNKATADQPGFLHGCLIHSKPSGWLLIRFRVLGRICRFVGWTRSQNAGHPLASASSRHGSDTLELTARGNVQIPGIRGAEATSGYAVAPADSWYRQDAPDSRPDGFAAGSGLTGALFRRPQTRYKLGAKCGAAPRRLRSRGEPLIGDDDTGSPSPTTPLHDPLHAWPDKSSTGCSMGAEQTRAAWALTRRIQVAGYPTHPGGMAA